MNKSQLKMILFVLVLGIITSGLLIGADALTKDRIAANEAYELQSTILFGETFNLNTINDVFEEKIEQHTFTIYQRISDETFSLTTFGEGVNQNVYEIILYAHDDGRFSFRFEGSGLWGPIIGILTLEADFETINRITILEQQETPGLGGLVATRNFLDQFNGKSLLPSIEIIKNSNPDAANEVDAITGATGTSNAFARILNAQYKLYLFAFEQLNGGDAS